MTQLTVCVQLGMAVWEGYGVPRGPGQGVKGGSLKGVAFELRSTFHSEGQTRVN